MPAHIMTPLPCCCRLKQWWRSSPKYAQPSGTAKVTRVSSGNRTRLMSIFKYFPAHSILKFLYGCKRGHLQRSFHGSYHPKNVIRCEFRCVRTTSCGENRLTWLSRFSIELTNNIPQIPISNSLWNLVIWPFLLPWWWVLLDPFLPCKQNNDVAMMCQMSCRKISEIDS